MKKAGGRAHSRTYQLSETVIILSHKIPVADVFQEVIISSVLVISWCRMMCKTSIEHHISAPACLCVYAIPYACICIMNRCDFIDARIEIPFYVLICHKQTHLCRTCYTKLLMSTNFQNIFIIINIKIVYLLFHINRIVFHSDGCFAIVFFPLEKNLFTVTIFFWLILSSLNLKRR